MYASQKVLGRIHTDKKIYNNTESRVWSAMRKIKKKRKKKDSDVWSKEVPATLDKNLGRPSWEGNRGEEI